MTYPRASLSDAVIADQGARLYRWADELALQRVVWDGVADRVLSHVLMQRAVRAPVEAFYVRTEITRALDRLREWLARRLVDEVRDVDSVLREQLRSAMPAPVMESRLREDDDAYTIDDLEEPELDDFAKRIQTSGQVGMRLGSPVFTEAQAAELAFAPVDGVAWPKRFTRIAAESTREVLSQTSMAFARGDSVDDLARAIRGLVDGDEYRARSIARTELARCAAQAKEKALKAFSDVIAGYEFIATWENTCVECGSYDGRVFGANEDRPSIPLHPQCGCTYAPVARTWRELGIPMDEIEPPGRMLSGGRFIRGRTTWRQWIRRQPAATQRRVLGAGRHELITKGRITYDDLPAPGGGSRPLRDLKRVAN